MDLKSYVLIDKISNNLYQKLISGKDILKELESYGNIIAQSVCDDFYIIVKEKLIIEKVFFYYDDIYYRQGSTACIIKANFEKNQNLIANFECLIDHQQILLRIKNQPIIEENLKAILTQIEEKYNQEGLIDLKSLQCKLK